MNGAVPLLSGEDRAITDILCELDFNGGTNLPDRQFPDGQWLLISTPKRGDATDLSSKHVTNRLFPG